jgi:hypothetical protein
LRDDPPPRDAAPRREVDADEMRAIFGAFQRGLDRGRKGLPTPTDTDNASTDLHHAPADPHHAPADPHHVTGNADEGMDTDDVR